MFIMGCLIQGVDQQVVHIYYQPALYDIISKEIIHEGLECGQGVAHSEEYNIEFEQPKWWGEGGLLVVLWFDEDIVVSPTYIKFGKD